MPQFDLVTLTWIIVAGLLLVLIWPHIRLPRNNSVKHQMQQKKKELTKYLSQALAVYHKFVEEHPDIGSLVNQDKQAELTTDLSRIHEQINSAERYDKEGDRAKKDPITAMRLYEDAIAATLRAGRLSREYEAKVLELKRYISQTNLMVEHLKLPIAEAWDLRKKIDDHTKYTHVMGVFEDIRTCLHRVEDVLSQGNPEDQAQELLLGVSYDLHTIVAMLHVTNSVDVASTTHLHRFYDETRCREVATGYVTHNATQQAQQRDRALIAHVLETIQQQTRPTYRQEDSIDVSAYRAAGAHSN